MRISLQLEHYSSFIIHPCSSAGLVAEVDGDVHDLQKEEDERRAPLCPLDISPKYDKENLGCELSI